MWKIIAKYFNKYPKRKLIAQKMLEYGLRLKDNRIYCAEIELSDSKISRAFDIDRRIISDTIKTIKEKKDLIRVYSRLTPSCNLKNVATEMNWGVIEIVPEDPTEPGLLAEVATILANNKISIRQAIGEDSHLTEEPRLFIVTEKPIPGILLPKIRQAKGVKALLIH